MSKKTIIIKDFKSNVRTCTICGQTEKIVKVSTGSTWRYLDSTGHKWNGKMHVRCYNTIATYKKMQREKSLQTKQLRLKTKQEIETAKIEAAKIKKETRERRKLEQVQRQAKLKHEQLVEKLKNTKTLTHMEVYGVEQCYNTKWGLNGEVLWQCSNHGNYQSGYCDDCRRENSLDYKGILKPIKTEHFKERVSARTDGNYLYVETIELDFIDGGIC